MNKPILEEWDTEPNELQFEHKGLKCLILRVEGLGHLCGYVGVKSLPKDFDEYDLDVHGSVTFNQSLESCSETMKQYFTDSEYVIGFDAAHYMDVSPKLESVMNKMLTGGTYKNIRHMKEETIKLANQLSHKELHTANKHMR